MHSVYETQDLTIIEQLEPVLSNAPTILGSSEPTKLLLGQLVIAKQQEEEEELGR